MRNRLEEGFLLAPRFPVTTPRHFPRAQVWAAQQWSRLGNRLGDFIFERGVHTTGHARELAHFHPDRVWYQASGWTYLRRVLPPREVGAHDVFVDLGSGKGRVLLQAAQRYHFARVIGVEISEELCEAARSNVEQRRARLHSEVEIIASDAADYEFPDDVTVVYLYYPFIGETFARVLDNIVSSLKRNPRRLRLIYGLPILEDQVLALGVFREVRTMRVISFGVPHRFTMYEADLR